MQMGKMPPQGNSVVELVELVVDVEVVELVVDVVDVVATDVVDVVDAVGIEVVDVEVPHASQQLPASAAPCRASQRAIELKRRQRSRPPGIGQRHAIRVGEPHVERAAHRTTAGLQSAGSACEMTSAFAASDTHRT